MNRVVVLKVNDYQLEFLKDAVFKIFEYLGGLEKLIPSNSRVLLKPNLLSARTPEECVDTNPKFIRAVVEILKIRTSRISLGDSPGGYINYYEVLEKSGMVKLSQELGVKIVKFEKARLIQGIPIAEEVLNADIVISLPKFKTHVLTIITAGVKNCFGCVPGLSKSEIHKKNPRAFELAEVLMKIYQIVNPRITILDAIWSMEGDGPSQGIPRNTGLVLASLNAISLDVVLSYLIGLDPLDIPTNRIAHFRDRSYTDWENIEILPEFRLDEFRIDEFKLPKISLLDKLPRFLITLGSRLIKFYPQIISQKCVKCGVCVNSCPSGAIYFGRKSVFIDRKKCILCLCCYEVCPQNAIRIRRSYLARKLGI